MEATLFALEDATTGEILLLEQFVGFLLYCSVHQAYGERMSTKGYAVFVGLITEEDQRIEALGT